jgi:hypothetical protein
MLVFAEWRLNSELSIRDSEQPKNAEPSRWKTHYRERPIAISQAMIRPP